MSAASLALIAGSPSFVYAHGPHFAPRFTVTPPASSQPPATQGGPGLPREIPLRKIILAVILAGSIIFFFLILFAGVFAVLREAAPHSRLGGGSILLVIKRTVAHFVHAVHHR